MGYFLMGLGISITIIVHLSVVDNWYLKSFNFLGNIIMVYLCIGKTQDWYVELMIFVETFFIVAYYYLTTRKSYQFYEQQYQYQNKANMLEAIPLSVLIFRFNKQLQQITLCYRNTFAKNDDVLSNDDHLNKIMSRCSVQSSSQKILRDKNYRTLSDEIKDMLTRCYSENSFVASTSQSIKIFSTTYKRIPECFEIDGQ